MVLVSTSTASQKGTVKVVAHLGKQTWEKEKRTIPFCTSGSEIIQSPGRGDLRYNGVKPVF